MDDTGRTESEEPPIEIIFGLALGPIDKGRLEKLI
jgi:hypothetical protein